MNKGMFEKKAPCHGASKKSLALVLALTLLIGCAIGGTVAWLTAESNTITNTFSTSTIGVNLEETTTAYKMIPGWDIAKDPKAWITDGSEAAYLFVKVTKSANFNTFMTYTIADGWTELTSAAGNNYNVYYREVTSKQMGESNAFPILAGNKVTVLDTVKKEWMTASDFTAPTLTFTAYAHQLYSSENAKFEAATAWSNVSG